MKEEETKRFDSKFKRRLICFFMFLLNPLSKSLSSHFSLFISIIIFLPEQVLAEPCDHHDNAAKGGRQAHVGEVVLNCFLQASEASGGGWSFRHWEGVVEHR